MRKSGSVKVNRGRYRVLAVGGTLSLVVAMLAGVPTLTGVQVASGQPTPPAEAPASRPSQPPVTPPAASPPASQPATRPSVPLPAKWHGKYVGELELVTPDKPGVSQKIPTELMILPIDGTPDVTWTLVYAVEQRQERKYVLKAVPGYPGRYLMDEQQGIMIDHALVGETLSCQFTVAGTLLTSHFDLREGGMYFEIFSSNLSKPRRTGVGDIKVDSFPVRTVQRGMLKKVD